MLCERCGEEILRGGIEDLESTERGLEYDYDALCEQCYNELEEGEED